MYPLKFEPIFKTIVWGGEKIAPYKGVETEQEHIGESWELSGVKGNESVVANGALKGRTIADLVKEYKGRLVGEHVYANTGDEFPLLIKFIDALSDLSVQVHPNDELAAVRHNGSKGKTEMWYVVDAEPGAHLLAGMTEEITPEEYERRVADGTITEVLARHDVHPGDVFFLPRHLRRLLHRRDPADLRHHLPHLRLRPAGPGRQAAPAPHGAREGRHRLQGVSGLPDRLHARQGRGDRAGILQVLHHQPLRNGPACDEEPGGCSSW